MDFHYVFVQESGIEKGGARLTISSKDLALLDKLHKVLLLLVDAGGEALLDGSIDSSLNLAALLLFPRDGLFFRNTGLSTFLASQVFTEVGVCAALVVEVDGVGL